MPLLGCGPGGADDDVFRVTALNYDGEVTLSLTFTQPIANAGDIDPNDFRISLARTARVTYDDPYEPGPPQTYESSFYGDLTAYSGGYDYYDARFSFASATLGASSDVLVLEMETAIGTNVCQMIDYYIAQFEMYTTYYGIDDAIVDMGMFVHYAGQDIPLESVRDQTLADIGPDWVLTAEDYMSNDQYGFPNLNPQLRIPCP